MNLAKNKLCGLDEDGDGTYTTEGIEAIADALKVNTALNKLDLRYNNIRDNRELRDSVKGREGFELLV